MSSHFLSPPVARALSLGAVLILSPVTAMADDLCDTLWFTRNLVFDRAGYCFASPLGQAYFSAECTEGSPELDARDAALVARLRAVEAEWDCDVDTSRTELSPFDTQVMMFMEDLPVPTGYESACLGWKGEMLMLRAAPSDAAQPTGFVRPGDDLIAEHQDLEGWSFYSMTPQGQGLGWVPTPEWSDATCTGLAG